MARDDNTLRESSTAPDSALPERASGAPQPGQELPSHYRWCFGCGLDHPTGLHMQLFAGEGLSTYGTFNVTSHHQGAPGLAHGGVLTTAMDEVIGSLNWLLGKPAVTAHLECDFRRPVPVGTTLRMVARVDRVVGRRVFMSAEALVNDRTAVSARATFVQVPLEHFLTHGNAEQLATAVEESDERHSALGPQISLSGIQVNP